MKKIFITGFIVLSSIASFAQTDISTIQKYSQVIATPRIFSNKVAVDADFDEAKFFLKDGRLKTYDGKLKNSTPL